MHLDQVVALARETSRDQEGRHTHVCVLRRAEPAPRLAEDPLGEDPLILAGRLLGRRSPSVQRAPLQGGWARTAKLSRVTWHMEARGIGGPFAVKAPIFQASQLLAPGLFSLDMCVSKMLRASALTSAPTWPASTGCHISVLPAGP